MRTYTPVLITLMTNGSPGSRVVLVSGLPDLSHLELASLRLLGQLAPAIRDRRGQRCRTLSSPPLALPPTSEIQVQPVTLRGRLNNMNTVAQRKNPAISKAIGNIER
jgi:hypothetical protein